MLKPLNLNLFSGLIIAIILLGVVSAAAVYTNAMTYRDLLLGFERQYMRQLVENEVSNILEEQAGIARSMGFDLQEGERFSAAFEAGDDSALGSVLNTFIGRTQGRNGLIDTVGGFVFDIDFQLRADSLGTAAGEGVLGVLWPGPF